MPILAVGVDARPVFAGEPTPIGVPAVAGPDDLPGLVDLVAARAAQSEVLVALLPDWGPARQRELFDSARMLAGPENLLIAETRLPPLAASVAASMLAATERRLSEGAAAAALVLPVIERRLTAFTWLPSVTKLDRVDVPFGDHIRSYVARRGFVAWAHPEPRVDRVAVGGELIRLQLPHDARMILADREGDLEWYTTSALPVLRGLPTDMVPPSESGPTWWGSKRLTEIVVYRGNLERLAADVRAEGGWTSCAWCTAPRASGTCLRCGCRVGTAMVEEVAE